MRSRWAQALALWVVLVAGSAQAQDADEPEAAFDVPSRLASPPLAKATPLAPQFDVLANAQLKDGEWWAPRDGVSEPLTVDARLQKQLTDILTSYQTPYAAVVALEPSTGRVLAMAEHSEVNPALRGLCTKALYPAASVFKVVTAAALLETGLPTDANVCFSGGKRAVLETQLGDSPSDSRCLTFAQALGHSANVAFAKLTAKHLDPNRLKAVTRALHFNSVIPFPVPTEPSLAAIPDDTYSFAVTGAGFGDVFMSPLHGALMAAAIANHGEWRAPLLFEHDAKEVTSPTSPGVSEQVLPADVADQLTLMMEETVTSGTARHIFAERGMQVAGAVGKTGSLADKRPFRDYTWFVGFAPKANPKIAVAAVIVNDPHWRIRATWLGREAMRLYLSRGPALALPTRTASPEAPAAAGVGN